jgi:hypothetical protein
MKLLYFCPAFTRSTIALAARIFLRIPPPAAMPPNVFSI